ncbi:hypothetical protein D3C76_1203720 [compost metagenome]
MGGGIDQSPVHIHQPETIGRAVPDAGGVALPAFQPRHLTALAIGGGVAQLHRRLIGIEAGGAAGQQIAQIPHRQVRIGGHQQRHGPGGIGGGRGGAVHHAVVVTAGIQLRVAVQPIGAGIVQPVVTHVATGQIRGHHGWRVRAVFPAGGRQEYVAADAGVGRSHSVRVAGADHQVPEVAVGGIYVAVFKRQPEIAAAAVEGIVAGGNPAEAVARRLDVGRSLRLLGHPLEQAIQL